ncbi:MAG: hexapeptide repeat-containing transferase [Bacteroidetes bacterium]|nr:hexapeptide repeat-containing transferase [Bacteroidota bacterium]
MNKDVEITDSVISDSAKINDHATIIRSTLGESAMVGKFSKMAYSEMDTLSYIGEYTIVINSIIKKFTSISWGVTIGPEEHDYKRVTNHSFLYSVKSFQLTPHKHYSPFEKPCEIGNDVWIGCNSTILRGVKIGDGAVIGANSLVNMDIPPYAIAVGSPAKIIKYRFSEEVIAALLDAQWWNLPTEVISANTELFAAEPDLEIVKKIKSLF